MFAVRQFSQTNVKFIARENLGLYGNIKFYIDFTHVHVTSLIKCGAGIHAMHVHARL